MPKNKKDKNTLILNIKGTDYSMKYVSPSEIEGSCGECDTKKNEIKIANNMEALLDLVTRIHEVFHACLSEISVSDLISNDLEEVIVDNLAKETVEHFIDKQEYINSFNKAREILSKKGNKKK